MFGAPPCRGPEDEQLVAKQVWFTKVAKAARAMSYDVIEGERMLANIKGDFEGSLPSLKKSWATLMDLCLEEVGGSMVTNLDMGSSVPPSTIDVGQGTSTGSGCRP